MSIEYEKKVEVREPTYGFAILRAARFAAEGDSRATFQPQTMNDRYKAIKFIKGQGIRLTIEADAGEPVEPLRVYTGFIIKSVIAYGDRVIDASYAGYRDRLYDAADRFAGDMLGELAKHGWADPSVLERRTCTWCDATVKWNEIYKEWECPNHGATPENEIEIHVRSPFAL